MRINKILFAFNSINILDCELTVEELPPPGGAASVCVESHAVPIGAGAQVDHQSGNKAEDDGVDWRESQVSMQVEEADVEFAFVAVQLPEQKERHQQAAHQEESVNRNGGVANGLHTNTQCVLLIIKIEKL
jgi:hypothetical protein